MVSTPHRIQQIAQMIGVPGLDTDHVCPQAIIDLKLEADQLSWIGAIVLFGSTAVGDASSKSDIDILVIPLKEQATDAQKAELMDLLHRIESDNRLKLSFSPLFLQGDEDPYFVWETIKDGAVVFCRPEAVVPALKAPKPYALISYNLASLGETKKKRVVRFLYDSLGGMRIDKTNKLEYIAAGVIMISVDRAKRVEGMFEEEGVEYSLMKVWR